MSDPRTSRPQDLDPRTYPASMQVEMMVGKIHRATVTGADLDYVGSITVDADLLDAAGILPGQKIDVVDITGGARLSTYTIPGTRGSGEICINGAAAHHVHAGDLVILIAYGRMSVADARTYAPRVVFVDAANAIVDVHAEPGQVDPDRADDVARQLGRAPLRSSGRTFADLRSGRDRSDAQEAVVEDTRIAQARGIVA